MSPLAVSVPLSSYLLSGGYQGSDFVRHTLKNPLHCSFAWLHGVFTLSDNFLSARQ